MKKILIVLIAFVFAGAACAQKSTRCLIQTSLGNITVELYPEKGQ